MRLLVSIALTLHLLASAEGHGRGTWRLRGALPLGDYSNFPLQGINKPPFITPNPMTNPFLVKNSTNVFNFNPGNIQQYNFNPGFFQNRLVFAKMDIVNNTNKLLASTASIQSVNKTALPGVQLPLGEKTGNLVTPLVRVPVIVLQGVKETGLEKAMLPVEVATSVKESVTNISVPIKATVIDTIGQGIEKSTEIKSTITDMVQGPIQKLEESTSAVIGKSQQTMEGASALKDAVVGIPLEKLEAVTGIIGEKIGNPLEKMTEIKNVIQSPIGNVFDPKQTFNDLVSNAFRLSATGDRKQYFTQTIAAMSKEELSTLQLVLQNAFNLKGLMLPVAGGLADLKEAVNQLSITGGDNDKKDILTQIGQILDSAKVSGSISQMDEIINKVMEGASKPIEQLENLKDTVVNTAQLPIQAANALKDAVLGSALEKVENVKDAIVDKAMIPVDAAENLKNAVPILKRISSDVIEDGKDVILDKVQLPLQAVVAGKESLPNLESLKDTIIEKAMTPAEIVETLKNTVPELKRIPSEIIEDGKDMILDKAQLPIQAVVAGKDAVVGSTLPNFENFKDTMMEKAMIPAELVENLKNIIPALKQIPSEVIVDGLYKIMEHLPLEKDADLKEGVVRTVLTPIVEKLQGATNVPIEKIEGALENVDKLKESVSSIIPAAIEKASDAKLDFNDLVSNAFRQSFSGDMKNYFKQLVGTMSNGELNMLQSILVNALASKDINLPSTGGLTDLKDAVHELITTIAGDNDKKETLSGIENLLDASKILSMIPDKQVLADIITKPAATISSLKDTLQSTISKAGAILPLPLSRQRRYSEASPRNNQMQQQQQKQKYDQTDGRRGKRSVVYGIGTPSQELKNFPPPSRLRSPIKVTFRQINSASPPDPYPKASESLSLPVVSIGDPATDKIMTDIKEGLRYVLQTKNDFTLAVHGTGTTGCHTVLDNLIETGDTVLVLINGYWGELMANMAERLGAHVIRYSKTPGTVFTVQEVATAIKNHRPDLVAVVQAESSTGVFQPLAEIGELCEKNGALLVVDAVSSGGMQPVFMDKNKIDAVYVASQKGLGAVSGLVAISLSTRAVQKIKSRLTPPRAYQTDLMIQAKLWDTDNPNRARFQSLSLPLLYALRDGLATIVEEKMENTFRRHLLATEHLNRGADALGLEHFVKDPKDRLVGFTILIPPAGKDPAKVARYILKNYNIEISTGFGPTAGKVLRIATFGSNADTKRIGNILRALKSALNARETSVSN